MKRKLFLVGGSLLVLLFIIWLAFFLINSLYSSSKEIDMERGMGLSSPILSAPSIFSKDGFSSESSVSVPAEIPLAQKKIIKNGFLTLVVEHTEEAVSAITKIVESKNGFVASLSVNDAGDKGKQASLTVRVPFNQFSSAFEEIKALARIVEVESVSGQDVTEQFIDLEAHLKNLRATEAQFLEVLRTAKTVEDVLKVQDRLSQTRGQIESLEGQLKYLKNQTDLATINISFSEEPTVSLSLRDFRPINVIKTSFQALAQGLIIMFNILIKFLFFIVPILLIAGILLGVVLFIVWRVIKKIKERISPR